MEAEERVQLRDALPERQCGSERVSVLKLLDIARRAGDAIMEVYSKETGKWNVQVKEDESPLTIADQRADAIIVEGLQKAYPSIPVISEEGAKAPVEEKKQYSHFFVVDPLDGTKEFINRNGQFTVNIALCTSSRGVLGDAVPVLGVVTVPALGRAFVGLEGKGAFRVGEPLEDAAGMREGLSGDTPSGAVKTEEGGVKSGEDEVGVRVRASSFDEEEEGLVVVASRSHMNEATKKFLDKYKNCKTVSLGSSLKILLLAEGAAQIYPRLAPTSEWDTCAAHAILKEAGGEIFQVSEEGEVRWDSPMRYKKAEIRNPFFMAVGKRAGSSVEQSQPQGPSSQQLSSKV